MNGRVVLRAAVAVSALSLAGCGEQPTSASSASAEEVGACRGGAPGGHVDIFVLGDWLTTDFVGGWLELAPDEARQAFSQALDSSSADPVEVDISQAEVLNGEGRDTTLVKREPAEDARTAAGAGASIVIGIDGDADDYTHLVVRLTDDGDIAFMANCHYPRYTEPFYEFVSDTNQSATPATVLRQLLRGERAAWSAFHQWSGGDAPPEWADRPADERVIDPEEAPPEVMRSLDIVSTAFDVPDSWHSEDELLCTRVPGVGWGDCTSLHFEDPIQLVANVKRGSVLELWMLGPEAMVTEPIARVGSASADLVTRVVDAEEPTALLFSSTSEDMTTEEVRQTPHAHGNLFKAGSAPLHTVEP